MSISRRRFIHATALATIGTRLAVDSVFGRAASAARIDSTLVVVFLRGGVDGLAIAAPYADEEYYRVRPTIALGPPRRGEPNSAIDLDGFFGLHPALWPLKPLYDEKLLAIVHAVGAYDSTRSHFVAQEFMETGSVANGPPKSGWLGRCAESTPGRGLTKVVGLSPFVPRSVVNRDGAFVTSNVASSVLAPTGWADEAERLLEDLYANRRDVVGGTGRAGLQAMRIVRSNRAFAIQPANGAVYPDTSLGHAMTEAAQFIKSGVGTRCIFVNVEAHYDTHQNQASSNATDFADLAGSLDAFRTDIGSALEKTLILVVSEFGRTVRENGSKGTDHGTAGAMMALGGSVAGGRVLGNWPGLAKDRLHEQRDLRVTTDFRDLFTEVAAHHLGVPATTRLFSGYVSGKEVGLFRG